MREKHPEQDMTPSEALKLVGESIDGLQRCSHTMCDELAKSHAEAAEKALAVIERALDKSIVPGALYALTHFRMAGEGVGAWELANTVGIDALIEEAVRTRSHQDVRALIWLADYREDDALREKITSALTPPASANEGDRPVYYTDGSLSREIESGNDGDPDGTVLLATQQKEKE